MKRLELLMILLCLCCPALKSSAQTVTGAVRGTVTDPSGAIVSGASVTATNTATAVQTKATTNQAGEYSIRFLQIGSYNLTVEGKGFEQSKYGPFTLEIDQTAKIDIALKVGSTSATVEVSGQYQPILNTESATLGETFTENTIANVPLNGRDFSQLTVYTPGAVAPGFSSFGGGTPPSATSTLAIRSLSTETVSSPTTICWMARRSTKTSITRSATHPAPRRWPRSASSSPTPMLSSAT